MIYKFEKKDLQILNLYIKEVKAYLEQLETEFLRLEATSENVELINDTIRMIHSIKVGSSFLGLAAITRLNHVIEITLEYLKNKKLNISSELIDKFLESLDLLSNAFNNIQEDVNNIDSSKEEGNFEIVFRNSDNINAVIEGLERIIYSEEKEKQESNNLVTQSEIQFVELSSDLLNELREQFVAEAFEHIEKIENDYLVTLDKNAKDKIAVDDIFRSIHSIKGGIGVLLGALKDGQPSLECAKNISTVTHSFETLLSLCRDKSSSFSREFVDLTYEIVDYLKLCVNCINENINEGVSVQYIQDKINKAIKASQDFSTDVEVKKFDAQIEDRKVGKIAKVHKEDSKKASKETLKVENQLQSIRVNQEKLDNMMNTIAELMVTKNAFIHLSRKLIVEYNIPEVSKEVKEIGASVNRISDELQNSMMSIRMVEVKTVFQKMPRIIRDVSKMTGKKINLIIEGEDTEIDKSIVEKISDPLVHIIRNSADHGIENSEDRKAKGKNETGTVYLRAYNKNKNVYIEVEDDGKGIDSEKIKKKAIEKGFIDKAVAEKMDRRQALNLIFMPGFSTAKKITEISGRGVGMDIVKSNITRINGTVHIDSEVDKGTKITIQLPLTLAVSRGLLIQIREESYIVPIDNIIETVKIHKDNIYEFNNKHFAHLRGEIIGIEWLSRVLLIDSNEEKSGYSDELNVVIVTNGLEKLGIVVDKMVSEQEFVIKSLSGHLEGISGISGSTLLGNGRVVLILNIGDVIRLAKE